MCYTFSIHFRPNFSSPSFLSLNFSNFFSRYSTQFHSIDHEQNIRKSFINLMIRAKSSEKKSLTFSSLFLCSLCFLIDLHTPKWSKRPKVINFSLSRSFSIFMHNSCFLLCACFLKLFFRFFFFTFQFNWFVRNIFFLFVIVPPRWSSVIVKPPEYEMDFLVLTHTLIGSLNINLFRSVSIFLFVFFLFYPFVALLCFISIYFLRFSSLFLPTSLWSYASFSQDEKQ